MTTPKSLAPILLAAVTLAACGDASSSGSQPRSYDFTAFEQEVQRFVDETPGIEGAGAILVDRDQGVLYEHSFGAFRDDRVYLLASSSKMIVAGVLMRLADDGLLDVDRPVADVVDWGAANPSITPAQLVSNSSGLVGLLQSPTYAPYICQYVYAGTLQDCARTIFTTPDDDDLVIPPDTEFRYGGGQWQVAGAVAEIASGKSWEQLVQDIYVEPCGLETLAFNNHFLQLRGNGDNPFSYPLGFDSNPANLRPTTNPNMEGGAYASIGDYGKLLRMHLRGGRCGDHRVLSEEAVRRMHTDRLGPAYGGSTGGGFEGYGLGWWVDRDLPTLTNDPGAYGAVPWIDEERGYAGFLVLEATSARGLQLFNRTLPLVNQAIDAAR